MKKILFSFLLTLTLTHNSFAGGYHYQIDVMSRLLGNQQGNIGALQMSWLYDEEITKILLQGEDLTPAKRQQSLQSVGNRIMADLQGLNYFTQLQLNGKTLPMSNNISFIVELLNDKNLRLLFDLPLAQAVPATRATFSISVADPNGTALLFYNSAERVAIDPSVTAQCHINLVNFENSEHGKATQRVDITCK